MKAQLTIRTTLALTAETREMLEALAEARGESMTAVIEEAIKELYQRAHAEKGAK